jgi:hypothetical protein
VAGEQHLVAGVQQAWEQRLELAGEASRRQAVAGQQGVVAWELPVEAVEQKTLVAEAAEEKPQEVSARLHTKRQLRVKWQRRAPQPTVPTWRGWRQTHIAEEH